MQGCLLELKDVYSEAELTLRISAEAEYGLIGHGCSCPQLPCRLLHVSGAPAHATFGGLPEGFIAFSM